MIYLEIDPYNPEPKLIRRVVNLLKDGGVIIYPTDTVYGLGCDLMNKSAIERVYKIKKMPKGKPLSFICPDLKNIADYAQVSNTAYKLMKRLIPGPYTFILPATTLVPRQIVPNRRTVGIRVPDNEICLALVNALGSPLISTSVPQEKNEILSDPVSLEKHLGDKVDLIIDGGVLASELSTVIDFTGREPEIVREGKGIEAI